jgi:translocation and assembly module TamB
MNSAINKGLAWTVFGIFVLIVAVVGAVLLILNTQWGTRWAAARATSALGGKLAIESVEGTIAGPLRVTNLRYRDPAAGIDVGVQQLAVDVVLGDLWHSLVHVKSLEVDGVDVLTTEPTEPQPPEEPARPFTLDPPIDVAIDSLLVQNVKVRNPEATLVEVARATFAGRWTDEALAIEQLDVQSPQGSVQFAGRVGQQRSYVGEGKGQFRWTAGEQTFAGTLNVSANEADAIVVSKLSAPLAAQLDVKIAQAGDHQWQLSLEVPRFDPREELMPDSSLQSLAASLRGEGTLAQGEVSGRLTINDEPLQLQSVRFTRSQERLMLQSLLRIGATAGELMADADISVRRSTWPISR